MKFLTIKLILITCLVFSLFNSIEAQENIKLELISIDSSNVKEDRRYKTIKTVEGKNIGQRRYTGKTGVFNDKSEVPKNLEIFWNNGEHIILPSLTRIKISADSSYFLLWGCDGNYKENPPDGNCGLYMYNRQGEIIKDMSDEYTHFTGVDISNNDYLVLANRVPPDYVNFDNRIRIFDPKGNLILDKIIGGETERMYHIRISPFGNYISYLYYAEQNKINYQGIYVINKNGDILFHDEFKTQDKSIKTFYFSPDEKYFFCDYLKGLTCYNNKFEEIWRKDKNISYIYGIDFILDKKLLLVLDVESNTNSLIGEPVKWILFLINTETGEIKSKHDFLIYDGCISNKNLLLNKDKIIISLDNIKIYFKLIYNEE